MVDLAAGWFANFQRRINMPHKRKKGKQTADSKANEEPDAPRRKKRTEESSNRRLEDILKIAADIRDKKPRFKDEKAPEPALKIRPHESVADFNRRVNTEYQPQLAATYSKIAKKKKKANAAEKVASDEEEPENVLPSKPHKDFAKRDSTLKFGEQALAPPIFTSVPKARPKRAMDIEADVEKQRAELSRKRILDAERNRAIESYRKIKKARQDIQG